MKIVLINQEHAHFSGPGGAERSVQSIAEFFAGAGHQVTFIAMTRRVYMRDMEESGIHSVRDINGVRTILVGKRTAMPTHADLLTPIVLDEKPDIVHTNVFHRAPQLWEALARLGIPLIHSLREYKLLCDRNMFDGVHDCGEQCAPCRLSSNYSLEASRHVDGVIGISRFTLERHIKRGLFPNASVRHVIPNSFRAKAEPPPKPYAPDGVPRIGFLGRMHASKGINLIIDVFQRTDPKLATLLMAGDLQDEAIASRVESLATTHDARYIGFTDPTQFFGMIDILLAPSIWHEPFGRIAIEAFAHGVAVIATERGGLKDIVTPGETGWLFDPEKPDELLALLNGLSELDAAEIARMRQNCLSAARTYLPEIVGEMYLDAYQAVIASKRATEPIVVNRVRSLFERDARARKAFESLRTNKAVRERRPLKVLIVSGEFPKLSETFVLNHITGLLDLGVDVRVIHTRSGRPEETPVDFTRYRLHDRVTSLLPNSLDDRAMRAFGREARAVASRMGLALAGASGGDAKMAATIEEARQALDTVDQRLLDIHAAQVVARAVADVDIIHCHFGHRPKMIFKYLDMTGTKTPVVCSFHGIDMSAHIKSLGPSLYDDIKQRLHKALPISEYFRQQLIKLGFEPHDVQVHRVGVDCTKFKFADRRRTDGEPLRLVAVGRCVLKKGFEYGIRGVAKALERRPDLPVIFTIIGDGTEMPTMKALVAEFGLAEKVHLIGAQPHTRVTEELARSHAMMAPSITGPDGDMEGIPTVTMEAMASGLPVISTFHSGIPEAVVDGYTGLLAAERDADGLAEHILTIYDNPDIGSKFGRQGRLHVHTHFNIARQNERIVELYGKIAFGIYD